MLKKPKQRNELTSEEADLLANRLADRPYEEEKKGQGSENEMARTTISFSQSLLREIEYKALFNKRLGIEPKNVSAIIREVLNKCFY
ncbi:hypothetical protein BJP41_03985 [Candidatus Williamhamiltonella defendens]|uniref:Uncharacterized protein n=1 Tax=Candidatus Williamhamiltonella defendens TaxID=138072 RepID=A0A2D3T1I4_9ENTR|nr:hypothetical protein [Candidatus Hamiltonella defensa]ATW29650.1 hypothetical protein BJP41_03985 [Candidatus Hamiltonella defensa]ATW31627.1 hypothetical protein BJP42_04055 [Candidatus Hamiltonella defensa]